MCYKTAQNFDKEMTKLFEMITYPVEENEEVWQALRPINAKTHPLEKDVEAKRHHITKLLAILLQNGMHDKNSHRVEAIESGKYVNTVTPKDAKLFIAKILSQHYMNDLRSWETKIIKTYQNNETNELVENLVLVPNVFYAAALL